jgi:hypothetical protein
VPTGGIRSFVRTDAGVAIITVALRSLTHFWQYPSRRQPGQGTAFEATWQAAAILDRLYCGVQESFAGFARPIRRRTFGDNRGSSLELTWNAFREVEFK